MQNVVQSEAKFAFTHLLVLKHSLENIRPRRVDSVNLRDAFASTAEYNLHTWLRVRCRRWSLTSGSNLLLNNRQNSEIEIPGKYNLLLLTLKHQHLSFRYWPTIIAFAAFRSRNIFILELKLPLFPILRFFPVSCWLVARLPRDADAADDDDGGDATGFYNASRWLGRICFYLIKRGIGKGGSSKRERKRESALSQWINNPSIRLSQF